MTRVCVLGPSGRMGRMVIEMLCDPDADDIGAKLVAAVDRHDCEIIGEQVASGIIAIPDIDLGLSGADVYIDFTTPASTIAAAQIAARRGCPAVIGTTGMGPDGEAAIDALAARAPVVFAPNYSLGVNVLLGLAARAARALGPAFDLEVIEIHHHHKRDAPSGTALALARHLADARGLPADAVRHTRDGDIGPRPSGEIGVQSLRGGDVVGEHTAYFFGPAERIEITHRATSRTVFAAGALHAAKWVVGKPPGRYGMADVLGL